MKIAQQATIAITPLVTAKAVDAEEVHPAMDTWLRDYAKQNAAGVLLNGPLGLAGANGGLSLGPSPLFSQTRWTERKRAPELPAAHVFFGRPKNGGRFGRV